MSFCSAQRKLLTESLFSLEGFPPLTLALWPCLPCLSLYCWDLGVTGLDAQCLWPLCYKYLGSLRAATLWWPVPPAHVTTLPSLHIHTFVVAHTQASIQTSLPTDSDTVSFANRQLLLHFSGNGSYSFPLLLLWHRKRPIKLNSCLKEELEIALPFLSSRKKCCLAEN